MVSRCGVSKDYPWTWRVSDGLAGIFKGGEGEDVTNLIEAYEKSANEQFAHVNYDEITTFFKVSKFLGWILEQNLWLTRVKVVEISICLYIVTVTACKISILCLYRRISREKDYLRLTGAFGVAVVLWAIIAILVMMFNCDPPRKSWNPAIPGHCHNASVVFIIMETVEIVFDIVQLCLPIPTIINLKLLPRDKIIVRFIILIGGM